MPGAKTDVRPPRLSPVGILYRLAWRRCQRRCKSLRELQNQGTVLFVFSFVFGGRHGWRDHLSGGENVNSVQGELTYHVPGRVYMVRHRRGRYVAQPLLSLKVATQQKNKIN